MSEKTAFREEKHGIRSAAYEVAGWGEAHARDAPRGALSSVWPRWDRALVYATRPQGPLEGCWAASNLPTIIPEEGKKRRSESRRAGPIKLNPFYYESKSLILHNCCVI
jgi:hypothetical protein